MYILKIKEEFCAAHAVCCNNEMEPLHGHNWQVELKVYGDELNQFGMLIDFYDLKNILKNVLSELDHQNLCCLPIFKETTTENIAKWIYEKLKMHLKNIKIFEVTVWETDDCSVTYKENERNIL